MVTDTRLMRPEYGCIRQLEYSMPQVRILFLAFAVLLRPAFCGEDADLRVGVRNETKAREFIPEVYRDVSRRLAKIPPPVSAAGTNEIPGAVWEKNDEAQAFIKDARNVPELYARLLIPPGFPNAVAEASKEVRVRAAAVLGQCRDRRALDPLINSSVYDPEEAVRATAAASLRLLEEPVAVRKLVDLAVAKDRQRYPWAVRKSACQALRRYGDKEALERLLKELSYELAAGNPLDKNNKLRGKAAGIGTENPLAIPDAPPDLQLSAEDLYPVLSAVKEVTGVSFDKGEKDMKTWFVWWHKEGAKFAFKP